ncbi:MAG: hypothetical protein HYZ47_01695 [Simkania negevensis]|nr:hypothetical protein [Simkania negevensis]
MSIQRISSYQAFFFEVPIHLSFKEMNCKEKIRFFLSSQEGWQHLAFIYSTPFKDWSGRTVLHLIVGVVEVVPLLGALVARVERFLFTHITHSILLDLNSSFPISISKEFFNKNFPQIHFKEGAWPSSGILHFSSVQEALDWAEKTPEAAELYGEIICYRCKGFLEEGVVCENCPPKIDPYSNVINIYNVDSCVLKAIIKQQLEQFPPLSNALKELPDVEIHSKTENYGWGWMNGIGKNLHGKVLSELREELRKSF